MYGGVEVKPHSFLTSVLDGGDVRIKSHATLLIGSKIIYRKQKEMPMQGLDIIVPIAVQIEAEMQRSVSSQDGSGEWCARRGAQPILDVGALTQAQKAR
jgi:hypothetical protein